MRVMRTECTPHNVKNSARYKQFSESVLYIFNVQCDALSLDQFIISLCFSLSFHDDRE